MMLFAQTPSPSPGPPPGGIEWADWTPIIVSSLALLFTVGSFWWMNWHKGQLKTWPPRSYAAKGSEHESLVLQLPFVFFNSGATPIVVRNLRVVFTNEHPPKPLGFLATVGELGTSQERQWARAFAVKGREVVEIVGQFQRRPGDMMFKRRVYPLALEGRIDSNSEWQTIVRFKLNVTDRHLPQLNENFLAHDNELLD